ncbi:MAG: L,D-transpeptidase family protein [Alphaproteobacteria bacterium]|nr:L,D-transpeptidase family protein [Alphaproteobacteria bacterium]
MCIHSPRRAIGIIAMLVAFAAAPAGAAQFTLAPNQTVLGSLQSYTTRASDTLIALQRPYDVGYAELAAANPGINPWLPGNGARVVIPTQYVLPDAPHVGIVINLGERRLYYFHRDGKTVETFPIGVGVEGKKTLVGATTVVSKEKDPIWYPPPSIHAEDPTLPAFVQPGPDNPLGAYALHLGWKNYLIHGTNKPDGIGRNVSHGCIHLYPEDIQHLFSEIPIGTPVRVVDQPVLAAWIDGRLYVAVHPSQSQTDQIDLGEPVTPKIPDDLVGRVAMVAGDRHDRVDWDAVERAGIVRNGILVPVTPAPPHVADSAPEPVLRPAASRAAVDATTFDAEGNIVVDRGPHVLPAVPPAH